MTARDLQVGDVVAKSAGLFRMRPRTIASEPTFTRGVGWFVNVENTPIPMQVGDRYGNIDKDVATVHRPQPDGTLKQVFPGVE